MVALSCVQKVSEKVSLATDMMYSYMSREVTASFGYDYILPQVAGVHPTLTSSHFRTYEVCPVFQLLHCWNEHQCNVELSRILPAMLSMIPVSCLFEVTFAKIRYSRDTKLRILVVLLGVVVCTVTHASFNAKAFVAAFITVWTTSLQQYVVY
ncbi:unnamed protein product [Lactuca virosa]|uniref:Sugar phosphate transporter domain-containing protein n=1 Tax=Lactuca virosa TaxID=75947 RepID=A0AAU9LXF7_9ASTR|nr:unnamed protein product [Lactuca virosa]